MSARVAVRAFGPFASIVDDVGVKETLVFFRLCCEYDCHKDSHYLQIVHFFSSAAPCFVQCIAYCLKREEAPKGLGLGGLGQ